MGARYGSKPEIEWLENPLTVDKSFEQHPNIRGSLRASQRRVMPR